VVHTAVKIIDISDAFTTEPSIQPAELDDHEQHNIPEHYTLDLDKD